MRTRYWVCGCIALGLSSGVFSAPSSTDWTTQEIRVSYADLDISRPAGAASLYHRIEAAARKVCTPASTGDYLRTRANFRACYNKAVDAAVAQVDKPALLALHRGNGMKRKG